jgi:hypothetical protein
MLKDLFDGVTEGPLHPVLGSGNHLMTALMNDDGVLFADFLPDWALYDGEKYAPEDHRPNMRFVEVAHRLWPMLADLQKAATDWGQLDSIAHQQAFWSALITLNAAIEESEKCLM